MTHYTWLNEKPDFTESCILITASYWCGWHYDNFLILCEEYVKWCTIYGEEYGDIADLDAEKYMTIPQL